MFVARVARASGSPGRHSCRPGPPYIGTNADAAKRSFAPHVIFDGVGWT